MKISNSEKELARIISENGGWRDGNYAIQDNDDMRVWFTRKIEGKPLGNPYWPCDKSHAINHHSLIPNWHQTILSREEYFHLYPAPDAKPEFCESVTRSIPEPESKPTIEQLAADYRNAKYYADRKQQEADEAKADAEAKLAELVAAGKALNLVIGVSEKEPELVITDWRDLQLGDIIEYVDGAIKDKIGITGPVVEIEPDATDGMHVRLKCDNGPNKGRLGWPRKWRFIRRP